MRLRSSNSLSTDLLAIDPLRLTREWQQVEISEKVATVLEVYAGSHIDIHPDDLGELKRVGRAVDDAGRVVKTKKSEAKTESKADAK
jgi:hypothetical protein